MNPESSPRQDAMVHSIRAEKGKSWSDVLLSPEAERQLREIHHWFVKRRVATRPVRSTENPTGRFSERSSERFPDASLQESSESYPVLFAGAAGSGKTLTAVLLGQELNKRVLRVDLSQVISRYIGETEKNLERIFAQAQVDDAILFFDEADALFGKRTDVQDAHDKYANQEVGYLLQRIEAYPGLVILATRRRASIDDAFIKRLRAIVHFTAPR